MKHAHGFLAFASSDTKTAGSGKARHRRGQWGRRAFRATAIAAVAAVISTGAIAAVAAPTDSSNASARFLSGTLLTSSGTLDSLAALQGATATNSGSPTADTETNSLDLSALSALTVDIPGGVTIPLSQFLQAGLVNQYAQASDNGVSRAASGAVSNGGIVDLSGTGAFPADAQIDLVNLLGNPASGVLDTANVQLGAVTGVAALDAAVPGGPATSCADLSNPTNCRDYNIANASLNLHSPLVSQLVSTINATLDTTSTTVNGLSSTLTGSVTGIVNGLLGGLGTSDLNVSVNANLKSALSTVLSGSLSEGGVTLDLASGTITANLDAIIGGLNNQAPNTPLLSATVINAVVNDLGTILTTLQTNINTALTTALNAVPVTISGGVCMPLTGCDAPLGGKLSLSYSGTLGDLVAGTDAIQATGTGVVLAILAPVIDTLSGTVSAALGLLITPVLTTALSTVAAATTSAVTPAALALVPVLTSIGSVIGVTLNVQEPGTAAGSYREVAARVSLLGGTGATVDLGRAEVGPNVVNAAVAPTITSIAPTHGPEAGGTVVTVTGTGFTGATGVTFDGTAGTTFSVVNDTEITVSSPAHAAGPVDVVVESPNGNSAPQTFTYDAAPAAPVISGLDPTHGPVAGGTVVTVTGTGFTGATGVTFDGTAGTTFSVVSDTEITVTSPAHAAGPVDVVVQSPNGNSAPQTFTYNPVTAVTGVTPNSGPEAGGTNVVISGSCFAGATSVTFGGVPATSYMVVDDNTITATTPAGTGIVDVSVTGVGDCGTGTLPGGFTYLPAASITSISPDHGPVTGGTVVTVTGTGLTGATGVTFDGIAGTAFTPISDTEATVTTPAHTQGAVPVVVQSPNGDSAPGTFTYEPVTTIDGVDPGSGPEAGGTSVTITGQCFTGATGVLFGTTPATSFTVVSDTQITAVAPAGTGTVDVTVVGAANCGTATDPGAYEYVPTPVIAGIAPQQGPETGGTAVTVTGTGFTSATGVTFDGIAGTDFTVVSDTEITVTTPAHAPGAVNVVVTDPLRNSDPGTFTYTPVTAIDGVNPGEGPEDGGTTVTITGQCFTGATGVLFGTTPATSFTVVSDTEITAVSPAGIGTVDVTVTGAQGCGNATDPGGFTYVPDTTPVITGLTPTRGPEAGGTVVTINGANFTGATDVTFDGKAGTSFTVDSDTQITVTTPAHVAATVNVVVHGPDASSSNAGAFTYFAVADIGGVDPGTGPTDGGTTVTITGQCFTGATSVLFGTTPAKSFTVVNDTTIRAVTPAGTGKVDVTVVGAGDCGSATLPHGFEYITAAAVLARTGVDVLAGTWMSAFALMLAGLVLVAIRRRRSAE